MRQHKAAVRDRRFRVKSGTLASVLEASVRQRGPNNMVARLLVIRMDSNEHKCQ
jgi:hypothetical protein